MSDRIFPQAILVFFIIIFFTVNNSYSQWQPDVRLTNDPAVSHTSDNNAECMVTSGNNLHIVWADNRDGNFEIYYKNSLNEGMNWSPDKRITYNNGNSILPSICVEGPVLNIVWQDNRFGNYEIYYRRSIDNGVSWSEDIRLTDYAGSSRNPSVTSSGSNIHVVWRDYRDGNYEIYYKHSANLGVNWGTDVRLTNDYGDSYNPSITLEGSDVHVAWQDDRDGNCEIYYKHSTDLGNTWGPDKRLTNNIGISFNPVISASPTVLHVLFRDSRDGEYDLFYKRSSDDGVTWSPDHRLTNNNADSLVFRIASSDLAIHLVWEDKRDGNYEIYYKRSTDEGLTWEADTRLTNNPGYSFYAFVSVSGSAVHVMWYDNRDGNDEIYYKRNPTANNPLMINNVGTETPEEFSLSQNYPNPFNPKTVIRYSLAENSFTVLKVFDSQGKEAAVLVNENQNAGTYEVNFDGNNLSSGIYFYEISAGEFKTGRKMLLIK